MESEDWKAQYKQWKLLKPFEVRLLDEGPKSLSHTWLVNQMWCEWSDIKKIKQARLPSIEINSDIDPWYD